MGCLLFVYFCKFYELSCLSDSVSSLSMYSTFRIQNYIFFCLAELIGLIKQTRPFLLLVSKAKAAKLVRSLVDLFLDMEAGTGQEASYSHLINFMPSVQFKTENYEQ